MQVEIGQLSLVAGWEAQVYALQTAGIDLFVSAKQVSKQSPAVHWPNHVAQFPGPKCDALVLLLFLPLQNLFGK